MVRKVFGPALAHGMERRQAGSLICYSLLRTMRMTRRAEKGHANARLQALLRRHLMHGRHLQTCQSATVIQVQIRRRLHSVAAAPPEQSNEVGRSTVECILALVAEEVEIRRDPLQAMPTCTSKPPRRSALVSSGRVLEVIKCLKFQGMHSIAHDMRTRDQVSGHAQRWPSVP